MGKGLSSNLEKRKITHVPCNFSTPCGSDLPDDSKLGKLKMWLGEKMADDHPSLFDPPQFISAFTSRAATIGLTSNRQMVNAMQNGNRTNTGRGCNGDFYLIDSDLAIDSVGKRIDSAFAFSTVY